MPGSIHPGYDRHRSRTLGHRRHLRCHRAARRHDGRASSRRGWRTIAPAQTGLLRLTWDNGDRTVLVNPELGGITLGWHLTTHRAGRAVRRHRRHGVPHARHSRAHGGARRAGAAHHQRRRHPAEERGAEPGYANVLGKPILVPEGRRHEPRLGDLRVPGRGRVPAPSRRRRTQLCPGFLTIEPRAACRRPPSQRAVRALSQAVFRIRAADVAGAWKSATCCRSCAASRRRPEEERVLEALRAEVLEANLELVRRGLVIYTFGNASGVVARARAVRHQAERRAVREDDARRHGDHRPRRQASWKASCGRRPTWPRTSRSTAHSPKSAASCTRTRATPPRGRRRDREIPCFGTTHADYFHGEIPVTAHSSREEIETEYEANTGVAIIARMKGIATRSAVPPAWSPATPRSAGERR